MLADEDSRDIGKSMELELDKYWEDRKAEELFQITTNPYSNIEKLSILINCCKGDAVRALKMFPRTGSSYEKAIEQLKSQYQDPKRVTMVMIRQLKSMKQCREDPRSLRNNLNDVQAVVATLRRQARSIIVTPVVDLIAHYATESTILFCVKEGA
ncbi:hypothetical protein OESDEN_19755 [Oesophagostomum dentatum]|uniref:Uncharacterized protein n=1 Tax=Oesophagostomum dentatum TaxID=61180 RepID=A0A0B1S5D8_OESDE|nr:hypothetical protein OESDEN_19755 [Oesophagostomum dentatum]